jgi:hypothetical protein
MHAADFDSRLEDLERRLNSDDPLVLSTAVGSVINRDYRDIPGPQFAEFLVRFFTYYE